MTNVLIVDDDQDVRESLEMVIGLAGFPVTTARHGREALVHLRDVHEPLVVVLDLMMPVMDGWEVLEHVIAEKLLPLSRIIVITAARDPRLPDGVRLMPKPVTVDGIVGAIRDASYAA
jgi:CheY-like chemotaxis protein